VDHRADLYALGIVGYEMLTGQAPFAGRPVHAILAAHSTETPEHITKRRSNVPAPLADLIMRCLEKRPADRPQSADDVLTALDALSTPLRGGPAAPSSPLGAPTLATQRRPWTSRAALAGVGVVALVTLAYVAASR